MNTIIKCNKCSTPVSTTFNSCPACNTPLATQQKISMWVWVGVVFCIVIGLGLNGAEPIAPPLTGTATFAKTYQLPDVMRGNGNTFAGDLWDFATGNPQVSTICFSTTIQLGSNKYGNPVFGDTSTIVLYPSEVNELRKYTDRRYAQQSSLPAGSTQRNCPTS